VSASRSRPGARARLLVVATALALVAACTSGDAGEQEPAPASPGPGASSSRSPTPTPAPTALDWGPMPAELEQARAVVRSWTPEQLAGGVLVPRYDGTDPETAAVLVSELHAAGVIMMGDNVASSEQVLATAQAVQQAAAADGRDWPAVVSVDQEGGRVARLEGLATAFPTFMSAGAAVAGARSRGEEAAGQEVVRQGTRTAGEQLRALGFTWVFAPAADVTTGPSDPTIGSRSASDDPALAAAAVSAAVQGYRDAGIVPVAKHYPGHGSVPVDSHEGLPVQSASMDELRARDLIPFSAAAQAGVPAVMMSHIAADAFDPGVPSTLSPKAYASLRADARFEGLAVTDALDMAAVTEGQGGAGAAVTALQAGADVLLMPLDARAAHAALTSAIDDGTVPRERAQEAAAKVVAVQRWQARSAAASPAGPAVTEAAGAASQALSSAAVTLVDGPCSGALVEGAVQVEGGTTADRALFAEATTAAGLQTGSGAVVRLLGTGTSTGSGEVVVALDAPFGLGTARGSTATLAVYGRTPGAFAALLDVLTGDATAQGALPVSIGRTTSTDC